MDRQMKKRTKMKTPSTILFLILTTARTFSQGHVNFANDPSLFINDPGPDRFVYCIEGGKLTGANWAAQLWYGIGSGLNPTELNPTTDAVSHFLPAGTGIAGTWVGGDRSLPGTSEGQFLTLQLRIWDLNTSPDWLHARGPNAESAPFSYRVPAPDSPSDAFVMYGFRGFTFTCLVPEPSTLALFGLGAVLACGFSFRAKRSTRRDGAKPCRNFR